MVSTWSAARTAQASAIRECDVRPAISTAIPAVLTDRPARRLATRASRNGLVGSRPREICAQIKDPDRNGGLSPEEVADIETPLVGWGWAPGPGREPAPGSRKRPSWLFEWTGHASPVAAMPSPQMIGRMNFCDFFCANDAVEGASCSDALAVRAMVEHGCRRMPISSWAPESKKHGLGRRSAVEKRHGEIQVSQACRVGCARWLRGLDGHRRVLVGRQRRDPSEEPASRPRPSSRRRRCAPSRW